MVVWLSTSGILSSREYLNFPQSIAYVVTSVECTCNIFNLSVFDCTGTSQQGSVAHQKSRLVTY